MLTYLLSIDHYIGSLTGWLIKENNIGKVINGECSVKGQEVNVIQLHFLHNFESQIKFKLRIGVELTWKIKTRDGRRHIEW